MTNLPREQIRYCCSCSSILPEQTGPRVRSQELLRSKSYASACHCRICWRCQTSYNGRPAADETINDPTVRKHYWRYRCHVNLESLLDDKVFLLNLQHMLLGKTIRHFRPFTAQTELMEKAVRHLH